ncbi:MAG: helix-turn-helix transcriptional regulator [Rhodospirillales bacterium]|nr:helix-turn-helix transcriptional regulator [Rhodospirillales bacterium]
MSAFDWPLKIQKIQKETYFLDSVSLEAGVERVERSQYFHNETPRVNVYTHCWMLYVFNYPEGILKVRVGQKLFDIVGSTALFIPPFAPVEWHYSNGRASWTCYVVHHLPEKILPKQALSFPVDPALSITGYADLVDTVLNAQSCKLAGILETENATACRTRTFLNAHFGEPIEIAPIAKELRIPYSTMAHSFRESYGLTPTAYRNNLRIFEALKLLNQGVHPTDVCYSTGFSDYSRFYRNFVHVLNAAPSDFLFTSKNVSAPADHQERMRA